MIQKKICLLGAFSVGKTSLIQQFVNSMFSDKYLTTVGVKVDKKELSIASQDVKLMIWDLAGEDDYSSLQTSYLRGAAGYILVVDGTRPKSLETGFSIQEKVRDAVGDIAHVVALNKADLEDQWQLTDQLISQFPVETRVFRTSAKTGDNVESLFSTLAEQML